MFTPGFQGYGSVTDEYPLYCTGFHHKSRTHSSFGFIPELEQVARQQLWINPADAESRGIASGDTVAVKSPAGEIRIEALVTSRIIPGTIGIPQGAWHKADMNGCLLYTSLRELYQTQIDLQQNNTMQFFTVITTLFAPLTLLTSWFGMNFTNMPGLDWRWGYEAIIAVSVIIVVIEIIIFKRKKWL